MGTNKLRTLCTCLNSAGLLASMVLVLVLAKALKKLL